jgi:hypothetical protein
MKIYVHHYYAEKLFYKLAHNSINKRFEINPSTRLGSVFCTYDNTEFEFYFNPEINDNIDGVHLLDFFTALFQLNEDSNYKNVKVDDIEDIPIIQRFTELLYDRKNWIVTIFRTERIIPTYDTNIIVYINEIADNLKLLKNHKIISDNVFMQDDIRYQFPNMYFAFTNTMWQWNEIIGIRWYYEYKQIFEKLNFDYDLMYSVRNHKKYRCDILKGLSNLNNERLLLQRTDSARVSKFYKTYESELSDVPNIVLNSIYGNSDFENITLIQYQNGLTWDLWFRMLCKAKVQVLDESWAYSKEDFRNQYFSEKTLGLVLANIPFISTHSYPIEMLQKVLNVSPHPLYEEFKVCNGDSEMFVKFVDKFLNNFELYYEIIKKWTNECHLAMINKIESENSMLDMIIDDFNLENKIVNNNKKFL